MSATLLTKTTPPGQFPTSGVTVTMTAADTTNGNCFVAGGKDLLIIQNTSTAAEVFSLISQPDEYGRVGNIISESLSASTIHVIGPLPTHAWADSNGKINLTSTGADIKFGVIALP